MMGFHPTGADVCNRCDQWMYETLTPNVFRCLCCDDENNGACPHRASATEA